ncbi:unnamed protein product, partial [marine sediment metagenome]
LCLDCLKAIWKLAKLPPAPEAEIGEVTGSA